MGRGLCISRDQWSFGNFSSFYYDYLNKKSSWFIQSFYLWIYLGSNIREKGWNWKTSQKFIKKEIIKRR